MTRRYAKAYEVVITTEDEGCVIVKFESTDELSRHKQEKKAAQILLSVIDDVESGTAEMEVKRAKDVTIDTTVSVDPSSGVATTQTVKTYTR